MALDESEVRKIIAQCKAVKDYIAIAQVIESMEDLLTFVKVPKYSLCKYSTGAILFTNLLAY